MYRTFPVLLSLVFATAAMGDSDPSACRTGGPDYAPIASCTQVLEANISNSAVYSTQGGSICLARYKAAGPETALVATGKLLDQELSWDSNEVVSSSPISIFATLFASADAAAEAGKRSYALEDDRGILIHERQPMPFEIRDRVKEAVYDKTARTLVVTLGPGGWHSVPGSLFPKKFKYINAVKYQCELVDAPGLEASR